MNSIDRILEDIEIFFTSGIFTIDKYRDYSLEEELRSPHMEELVALSEDDRIEHYLKNCRLNILSDVRRNVEKMQSSSKQQALIFGILFRLNYYCQILSNAEHIKAGDVLRLCEDLRDQLIRTYADILDLKNSDFQTKIARPGLSSFFRGTDKLRFNLTKVQLTALFKLLIDKNILNYPQFDSTLSSFLENNCKYRDEDSSDFIDITQAKDTISKLRNEDTIDAGKKKKEIIDKFL